MVGWNIGVVIKRNMEYQVQTVDLLRSLSRRGMCTVGIFLIMLKAKGVDLAFKLLQFVRRALAAEWKDLRRRDAANRSPPPAPDTYTYRREPFAEARETGLLRMRPGHE